MLLSGQMVMIRFQDRNLNNTLERVKSLDILNIEVLFIG